MASVVEEFINDMKGKHAEAMEDVFGHGYCYWFAVILCERFDGEMFYLEVDNHWIVRIKGKFYDITGEVSGEGAERWSEFVLRDPALRKRLYRDCIWKAKNPETMF